MAIRFYSGGTTGNRNGTLISSGDNSAPLLLDGLYPGAATVNKRVTIHVRADFGEVWKDVVLEIRNNSGEFIQPRFSRVSFFDATGDNTYYKSLSFYWYRMLDYNVPVKLYYSARPTDTNSPDSNIDLIIRGRRVV